jgi:ATP-dependent Clp protease ATP-binding subunit ClpA
MLRLGDNTMVNFEKSIVFLTSNLGAREMGQHLRPDWGFEAVAPRQGAPPKLEGIAMNAVRRNFPPEFVNRIDAVVTYRPLGSDAMAAILDQQIFELQEHIDKRLGAATFQLDVPAKARRFLMKRGISTEYGARELKRTLQRLLIQPLASMIAAGEIAAGARVRAEVGGRGDKLIIKGDDETLAPAC